MEILKKIPVFMAKFGDQRRQDFLMKRFKRHVEQAIRISFGITGGTPAPF
jgi:hypothetical protein